MHLSLLGLWPSRAPLNCCSHFPAYKMASLIIVSFLERAQGSFQTLNDPEAINPPNSLGRQVNRCGTGISPGNPSPPAHIAAQISVLYGTHSVCRPNYRWLRNGAAARIQNDVFSYFVLRAAPMALWLGKTSRPTSSPTCSRLQKGLLSGLCCEVSFCHLNPVNKMSSVYATWISLRLWSKELSRHWP